MLHKSDYVSDGVPLINPTNIVDEAIIPDVDKQVGADALLRLGSYVLKAGDVVVGRRGEIGRCAVVSAEEDGWICGTGCFFVRPRSTTDPHFLAQLLRSPVYREQLESASTGATMKNMSNTTLAQLPIAIPSVAEQRRIIAILDEAFEGIATAKANAEKNLQNARGLLDSHLQRIDGPKVPLGDLVQIKTGKLDANAAVDGGEYPFFTCSREISAINEHAFDCEALLLAGNNAVGDFNVKHYQGKFNAYQRTYVITVEAQERALCRFLYFELLKGLARFKAQSVGVGTKFLKLAMIKELEVTLPELSEQHRLASVTNRLLDYLARLEDQLRAKLAALDELKKSLLHQAFSGQL
jgi:type I restriction enzyme S subunit